MDYNKIYNNLINKSKNRQLRGYVEVHHIIPKSMGGSNFKDNLVELTAREHFLAHWLLYKIHKNTKMAYAFFAMTRNSKGQKRILTTRKYEIAKNAMSNAKRGKANYWYGTSGPMGGKSHTLEFKENHKEIMKKASEYKRGKSALEIPGFNQGAGIATQFGNKPAWNKGLKGTESHCYGRLHKEEAKQKMKKPKQKVFCPYCGQIGGISQMKRWHYENCKQK